MTPIEVWEDCNPVAEDLSVDVVRAYEEDGVVYEKIYYTVKKTEQGECRAYTLVARPKKKGKLPVVLIAPSPTGREIDKSLVEGAVKDGYVAVVVDLEGQVDGKQRYTFYPDDLDYCNLSRTGRHIQYAEPSARETIWYNWTYVVRRAITLISSLDYADDTKIALVGVDQSSLVAWQTAGMDGRLACMVSIFGYNPQKIEEEQEEKDCWLSGVDQRSYAPFVTVPVLHVGGTNTNDDVVSFTEKTVERMKDKSLFYADYGFGNEHALTVRQINTIKEFIKKVFSGEQFAQVPTMEIEKGIDGEFKIKINAPSAKSAEIWYAYLTEPKKVFWKKVETGKKNGELIASFSLAKEDERVVIYARANYSKFSIVSRPSYIETSRMGASVHERRSTRILFDGTSDKNLIPIVEDKLVFDNSIEVVEGALGLMGVTVAGGGIAYVFDPEQPIDLTFASSLQFEVYSLSAFTLSIRLYSGDIVYKMEKKFRGGTGWQRVHLSSASFKNENMQKLSSFEEVWKVDFPNLQSALIRNVLLI